MRVVRMDALLLTMCTPCSALTFLIQNMSCSIRQVMHVLLQ